MKFTCKDELQHILRTLQDIGFSLIPAGIVDEPKEPVDKRFTLLIPERAAFRRPQRRHAPIMKTLPLPAPIEKPFNSIEMIKHRKHFGNSRNRSVVGKILRS